jgi:hypothetical protein
MIARHTLALLTARGPNAPPHPFCPIPDKPKVLDFRPVDAHPLHGAALTKPGRHL